MASALGLVHRVSDVRHQKPYIEPLRGTGEDEGTTVEVTHNILLYTTTTRHFPVMRVPVAYLGVCYIPQSHSVLDI